MRSLVTTKTVRAIGTCALVCVLCLACTDVLGPRGRPSEAVALVRLNGNAELDRTHHLLRVGLDSRSIIDWSEEIMFRMIGVTVSPDRQSLYAIGTGRDGWKETQIVEMDVPTLRTQWREFVADSAGYRLDRFDGIAIQSSHEIEVSPDGRTIFTASAERHGDWGVAALDSDTRDALGFLGIYSSGSMTLGVVPPGPFSGVGALAVSSPYAGPRISFWNAETLEVIDSVDVMSDLPGSANGIMNMVADPSGTHLYLRLASGWLLKYDLLERRMTASTRALAPACIRCLTLTSDGQRLYLAHTWTHDGPSSGIISVYDADLNELEPIDLSAVRVPRLDRSGTDPPALNMVAVAPDGMLVVATGAMLAQLWGSQSARIYFVDPATHAILDVIALDGEVAAVDIVIP